MGPAAIARTRLSAQRLSTTDFTSPLQVVSWLGAVQAQDYYGAKWGIGQRMRGATDAAVEAAVTRGTLIRTHVLRPTWHFVAAADVRWLLALSGPRVNATMASYYRRFELDAALFRRTHRMLARALAGGVLTRGALRQHLQRLGIAIDPIRLAFILMRAELDGVICSGPRLGKQFTYALLDERVPPAAPLPRDEALAALTRRYFVSRGPATLRDFTWWSGLTMKDARVGVEILGRDLSSLTNGDGERYWLGADAPRPARPSGKAYLLPLYDEFLIAYKDRSASVTRATPDAPLMIDGQVVGGWRRSMAAGESIVTATVVTPAVASAVRRYAAFLGMAVRLASSG